MLSIPVRWVVETEMLLDASDTGETTAAGAPAGTADAAGAREAACTGEPDPGDAADACCPPAADARRGVRCAIASA